MKVLLYIFTIACVLGLAFWEMKLKRDLTSLAPARNTAISDLEVLGDMAKRFEDERFLSNLPKAMKQKLRRIVTLKFVAVTILILEVICLQR